MDGYQKMKNYKQERKRLKGFKREAMKFGNFKHSGERKNVVDGFKREQRALKRSERNAIREEIKGTVDELE